MTSPGPLMTSRGQGVFDSGPLVAQIGPLAISSRAPSTRAAQAQTQAQGSPRPAEELLPRGRPAPALRQMIEDRGPHARVPIFLQMIRDAGGGLIVALAGEELADLIGHVDQLVRRHC